MHSESDSQTSPEQSQKSPTRSHYGNIWRKSEEDRTFHHRVEVIPTFSCPPKPTSSSSFLLEQNASQTAPYPPPICQTYPTGGMVPSSAQTSPFFGGEKEYDLIQVLPDICCFLYVFISFLNPFNENVYHIQELLKLNIEGLGPGIDAIRQNSPNTATLHSRLQDVRPSKQLISEIACTKFPASCDIRVNQSLPSGPVEQVFNQVHSSNQQQLHSSKCWSSTVPIQQVSTGKHCTYTVYI